jgi:hypothetical protein
MDRPSVVSEAHLLSMLRRMTFEVSDGLLRKLLEQLRKRKLVSFRRGSDELPKVRRPVSTKRSRDFLCGLLDGFLFDISITERGIAVVERAIEERSVLLLRR